MFTVKTTRAGLRLLGQTRQAPIVVNDDDSPRSTLEVLHQTQTYIVSRITDLIILHGSDRNKSTAFDECSRQHASRHPDIRRSNPALQHHCNFKRPRSLEVFGDEDISQIVKRVHLLRTDILDEDKQALKLEPIASEIHRRPNKASNFVAQPTPQNPHWAEYQGQQKVEAQSSEALVHLRRRQQREALRAEMGAEDKRATSRRRVRRNLGVLCDYHAHPRKVDPIEEALKWRRRQATLRIRDDQSTQMVLLDRQLIRPQGEFFN